MSVLLTLCSSHPLNNVQYTNKLFCLIRFRTRKLLFEVMKLREIIKKNHLGGKDRGLRPSS